MGLRGLHSRRRWRSRSRSSPKWRTRNTRFIRISLAFQLYAKASQARTLSRGKPIPGQSATRFKPSISRWRSEPLQQNQSRCSGHLQGVDVQLYVQRWRRRIFWQHHAEVNEPGPIARGVRAAISLDVLPQPENGKDGEVERLVKSPGSGISTMHKGSEM
ncbi:lysin [Klebsiella phage vB_KshKPC-M]|nr:lysin [Klebsiella phage vB_KshKPC-M]